MLSSPPHLLPILTHCAALNAPAPAPSWLAQSRLSPFPGTLVANWLFDEGSLTRRLSRLSHDAFSVTPLVEGWQALRNDECAALGLPEQSEGWVREVYLRGHGEAWVFARSVAARSALLDGGLNIDELGSRSWASCCSATKPLPAAPSKSAAIHSSGCRRPSAPAACGAVARASTAGR